jgi:hypothetical protein
MPPMEWVVPELHIVGRGRPTLIYGPPAAGKSITMGTLALAAASGRPWIGGTALGPMSVLWIDGEVGRALTQRRLQRIARAMDIGVRDLGDRIRLAVYPALSLDHPDAERVLMAKCAGYTLIILDSLTALSGSADEHTIEMGRIMLMLARVSARSSAAIVVLHHSRRDGEVRGSTSITGGSECIWSMESRRDRVVLRHERSPMGDRLADIEVRIVDVAIGGDSLGGLALERAAPDHGSDPDAPLLDRVVRAITAHPGCSLRAVRMELGGRASAVDEAVAEALQLGRIHDRGSARASQYHPGGAR